MTIALPVNGSAGSNYIQTSTLQTVTFSGDTGIIVPNGALVVSDPLNFTVKAQSMITVTMYLAKGQASNDITSHPGSRTTSWVCFGDYVNASSLATGPDVSSVAHWLEPTLVK